MATGLVVPRLLEKLCNLQNDEVDVGGGLQDQVKRIMAVLKSIPSSIRDTENRLNSSHSIDEFPRQYQGSGDAENRRIDEENRRIDEENRRRRFDEELREFLKWLDLLDDITHTLLLKKEQRGLQKSLIKMFVCPLIPRLLGQSDGQIRLSVQMEEFLTYAEALPNEDADMRPQLQETRSKNVSYLEDDDSDIIGFEKEAEELANKLISSDYDDMPIIAVVGKAGSGKTALTKKVYNSTDIKHHFECRAWVSLPPNVFIDTELRLQIWTQLTGEREVKNLRQEELKKRVNKFLEEKTSLLVIDDVSLNENQDKIYLHFPLIQSARSRIVLITSKNENLRHTIRLRNLTDESWTLFMKKANISEDNWNDPVLNHFKKDILRKCDGWPLAIALLGRLLSTRDLIEWSSVIEHQKFQEDIFVLSYQDLPSKMKPCFLYLLFFPRKSDIPVRRLLHLWVAEGLVTPLPDERNIASEDLAEKYFKELVWRSMIQVARLRADGSPKSCRVPRTLYEFYKKVFSEKYFYHNLTIGKHDQQERGMFLKKVGTDQDFRSLRVLDLEGNYKPMLPESFGKLLLLKYIGLRRTFLDSLPVSIGDLPHLETLDIKHTRITTLNNSIWNAKKLRHLYMNNIHFHIPCGNTNSTGSLTNLQTLWGLFIGDKSLVENCLNKSIGLKKLGLTCLPTSVEAVSKWVSDLTNLQSLKLRSCDEFGRPSVLDLGNLRQHNNLTDLYLLGKLPREIEVDQLPPNLKILTLSASQLEKDPMPVLGKLRHLKVLRLFGYSYLRTTMTCLAGGFPELCVLKLWVLENLEEWIVEQGAMPRLRELEIRCCNSLKKIPEELHQFTPTIDIILTTMPENFVSDARHKSWGYKVKANQWNFAPFRFLWHPTPKEDPRDHEI